MMLKLNIKNVFKQKYFVLVVFSCLVFFSFLNADKFLIINNPPQKADIIVCLGGGSGERLVKTIELYKKGYANKILLTQSKNWHPEVRDFFLNIGKKFLISKGVLDKDILVNNKSKNTFEEATFLKNLVKKHNIKTAIIVSDPYHMQRVKFLFEKVLSKYEVKLLYVPAESECSKKHFWQDEKCMIYVFNEYVKLLYCLFKY